MSDIDTMSITERLARLGFTHAKHNDNGVHAISDSTGTVFAYWTAERACDALAFFEPQA